MDQILEYIPAAIVALVVGLYTQHVTRKAQEDTADSQRAANRLNETQQALDARGEDLKRKQDELEASQADVAQERAWRIAAEDRERQLHAIVVGQIEVEAHRMPTVSNP